MLTSIIEFTAIVLIVVAFWHAAKFYGLAFAQQWFIAGYLAAILRETIQQVMFGIYFFPPDAARIGAAPALITLLPPALFYVAYQFALRFIPLQSPLNKGGGEGFWRITGLVFVIAASIGLPLEVTAVQAHWWAYETPARALFGAPFFAPFVWGGGAAIFYATFAKVAASPLPARGKLYAMITLAPVIAAAHVLWILLLSAVG
jgi:hypothetical protein